MFSIKKFFPYNSMIRQILKEITGIFDDSDPNPLEAIKKKLGARESRYKHKYTRWQME